MAQRIDAARVDLLDRVVHLGEERSPERARLFADFVREYFVDVDGADLLEREAIDLYGAAAAHLRLGEHRHPGQPAVRVYNPDFEQHGWQSTHSVLEVVTDDMPFLVDSLTMMLNECGNAIHLVIHPVLSVGRDEDGTLRHVGTGDPSPDPRPVEGDEAWMHIEFDRQPDNDALNDLKVATLRVLGDVRVAVDDWPAMHARAGALVDELGASPQPVGAEEVAEARALLSWLADDHFVFLGYREYELITIDGDDVLRAVPGTGLGILRETVSAPRSVSFDKLPPDVRRKARERTLLTLTKANSRSTVHRPSYLAYVGIKRFDAAGDVTRECRFLGLHTAHASTSSPLDIPVLRRKVGAVLDRAGFPADSHSGRDLLEILENYPRDELYQISDDDLYRIATGILRLQERQRVRAFVRRDDFGRFFSCLVYVPRDRFSTALVHRMETILVTAYDGTAIEHAIRVTEAPLARIHFVVHVEPGSGTDVDVDDVESRLAETARSWPDDLHRALVDSFGEAQGLRLYRRYRDAFPASYREDFEPRHAVGDIRRIETLDPAGDLGIALYHPGEAGPSDIRLKLYRYGGRLTLSDVLPVLENMGVRVVDERPHEIAARPGSTLWLYDFGLATDDVRMAEDADVRADFQDAFSQVWRGEAENDGFNRLVLRAGLDWREVTLLRAYAKYLRQTGMSFSQAYMEDTLAANPSIALLLVELFAVRLDPRRRDAEPDVEERAGRLEAEVLAALDAVASLDQDRILRAFLALVQATLRTNWYRSDGDGLRAYTSFKLDPRLVPGLPLPRPLYEVWVYSPRMEGIHLRGGKVARGGIRWSDRREDFRTEILGLMRTQMVKNAVIVPVGAKGGFVVKQPPADRDALAAEVQYCYRTLIRGLLDLTDNYAADGEVLPPPEVVRHDGDDPYLVVAADKGTATFSDIANDISIEYGFWLGDAFASGGSAGYDHKAMGITARGAWESVRRHLRSLGLDADRDSVSVVGIGDMSGDVFGNGMLLSRELRLVAAFDHRHVFIDPSPDPHAAWTERARLAVLPRSSWADYDRALISMGGGVWSRSDKSIALSPEAQHVLGFDAPSPTPVALTPTEVIRAILRAPVDLLWNGGIGTYVKSSSESQADAGDRTNDAVRVDGVELRAKVVGEGGNLGFTQRGRIEYAQHGGRINTDAIDNSAGVDCSDHEVNIKILLDRVVATGDLTVKQRNELLAEMTSEVAQLVLDDNRQQTRALANARAQAAPMLDVHARYIRALHAEGLLDRDLERLPTDKELAAREAEGLGLTAPEMAVLLSYTKITNTAEVLTSDLPDDPALDHYLVDYFPTALRTRFVGEIHRHRLRREIVATEAINAMVDKAGISFDHRMTEETGAAVPEIVRAHFASRTVFDLDASWDAIDALESSGQVGVDPDLVVRLLLDLRRLVERGALWLLRHRRPPIDITATVAGFRAGATELATALPALLTGADRVALDDATARFVAAGVPADLAARCAGFGAVFTTFDLVEIATARARSVRDTAAVYFGLADRLSLDWLRDRISALGRNDRWQTLARAAMRDDLLAELRALTAEVLREATPGEDAADVIDEWVVRNRMPVERCRKVLSDIRAGGVFDLATLSVGLRELRNLRHQV